jgi:hypothetical protein
MYKRIISIVIIVLSVMLISSCGALLGVSIEDTIDQFESDLNGSRSNIVDNFSESCDDYNLMNTLGYWNDSGSFDDDYQTFNISIPSDPSETFTTTFTDTSGGGPYIIKFSMVDKGDFWSGENWKIRKIWITDMVNPYIN